MPSFIDFTLPIGDQPTSLRLYAKGAIYWPDGETLFITDPHFGKADSFRHAGIAIPTALLDHDLFRLTQLIQLSHAKNLVVLGDFFHSRHSQSDSALFTLDQWRNLHATLDMVLVRGNHDLHAGPPPSEFGIQSVEAPYTVGPFVCHHHPQQTPSSEGYTLAGHIHPYVVMRDRDGSSLRLPGFIFTPHQAILPAFGAFTGGSSYAPTIGDRVFVLVEGEIVEVPTTRQRPPTSRR